jgi:Urate oxidase N-terminal
MVIADIVNIVSRNGGAFTSRWLHVVVGITWIGLLYYFNFVQVPAFAEMEAAARNNAIDKLASRALWWFRWAAAATVATGILILLFQPADGAKIQLTDGDYWKSTAGMSIATGILLGLTMFLNVWLVIWPKQKKVIANARNVQAGGEADPAAAAAGRKAAMASRMNTIFSLTLLLFMVGTAHFFANSAFFDQSPSGSDRALYWIVTLVIWGLLELNALGVIGGTKPGGLNWIYDTHQAAIITGFILVVVYYALFYVVLKA